jgi:hypothetical protein
MWIGSIRLRIRTEDVPHAGTDSEVRVTIMRDGQDVQTVSLDLPGEDNLERGTTRDYVYTRLERSNDQTPELPDGLATSPSPYPSYGVEFSDGVFRHLGLRFRIRGSDMWIKDNVDIAVREIEKVPEGFDSWVWRESSAWIHVGTRSADVRMSTDSDEGVRTMVLSNFVP